MLCLKLAISLSIYIDDGLIVSKSERFCKAGYMFSVFVLIMGGWTLQEAKCISVPKQQILYLGYHLNSDSMRISVPEVKIVRVCWLINEIKICFDEGKTISCKFLASLCGLLAHLIPSHGKFISIISRHCNNELGRAVTLRDWNSYVVITQEMLLELNLCRDNIGRLNGQPLVIERAVVSVIKPFQVDYIIENMDPRDKFRNIDIFVSDSSEDKAFFFKAGDVRLVNEYLFSQTEQELSSSFRELLAVKHSFELYPAYFESQRGSLIVWITDSTALCSFLEKGSRISDIQKVCLEIKILEYKYGLKLKPKWISRDENLLKLADKGSKLHLCSDQYGLSNEDFLNVQIFAGKKFNLDGFATAKSSKTLKFISECPQLNCLDVDFFTHTMSSEYFYYLHPPPKLLNRLVSKIKCYCNVKGVIILPVWQSHNFWVSFVKQGIFEDFVKNFMIFSPFYVAHSQNSLFQGRKHFQTLAILFDTSSKFSLVCPNL